jgi:hypothetical protein
MDGACGTCRSKSAYRVSVGKLEGMKPLDSNIDRRIILK